MISSLSCSSTAPLRRCLVAEQTKRLEVLSTGSSRRVSGPNTMRVFAASARAELQIAGWVGSVQCGACEPMARNFQLKLLSRPFRSVEKSCLPPLLEMSPSVSLQKECCEKAKNDSDWWQIQLPF